MPANTRRSREAGHTFSFTVSEGASPADTWILTVQPPDCETIDLSCLSLLVCGALLQKHPVLHQKVDVGCGFFIDALYLVETLVLANKLINKIIKLNLEWC